MLKVWGRVLLVLGSIAFAQAQTPFLADTLIEGNHLLGYKNGSRFSILPVYIEASHFSDGLALVKKNEYYTYINPKGKVMGDQLYVEAKTFSEGLAAVKLSTGWGFVNTHLHTVIQPEYENVFSFSEGAAAVKKKKWGFVNKKNTVLVGFESDTVVANFSNGAAIVGVRKEEGWRYGLMSAKGKWLVQTQYTAVHLLAKGLFSAETEHGYFTLLNSQGVTIAQGLEYVKTLSDSTFLYEKHGFRYVVDDKGNPHFKQALKGVTDKGQPLLFAKWKLIDTTWKQVKEIEADSFTVLGKALVRHLNDKKQIIWPDTVPAWYEEVNAYSSSLFKVKRKGKWALLDLKGNLKTDFVFDSLFKKGKEYVAMQNSKVMYLDSIGNPLLSHYHTWLQPCYSSQRLFYKRNDTCGYYQKGSSIVRQTINFDSLSELGREFLLGWKQKEAVLLDDTLKQLSSKVFKGGARPLDTIVVLYDRDTIFRYDLCAQKLDTLPYKVRGFVNDTLLWVKTDTSKGVYHLASDTLMRVDADTIWPHSDLKTRLFARKADTLGLVDITGKWQTSFNRVYRYIGREENGYMKVISKKRWGFADTNGFLRIATQYDSVGSYSQGYFAVKIMKKWGVVDKKEHFVIHPNYSKAGVMYNGKIAIWVGPLAMLVDETGKELFTPRFHDIQPTKLGLWRTRKGSNYGFLNGEGKDLLTPRFEKAQETTTQHFVVRHYGKEGILDKNLQEVWPIKEKEIRWIAKSSLFAVRID